ncbi:hypothetical protein BHE74_00031652 [Ensete ventricosum]|nr:hypothetical protein GW17_00004130 [Ensete ventricosum]RWW61286.1 hypothetical protein BHE74_00031652 [Ensete ventricosum]RZS28655.1 hypothetical protein BHM03_00062289 [Ensete ventricosum]
MKLASENQTAAPSYADDQTIHELRGVINHGHHRSGRSSPRRTSKYRLFNISFFDESPTTNRHASERPTTPPQATTDHRRRPRHLPRPLPRYKPATKDQRRNLGEEGGEKCGGGREEGMKIS